MSIWRRSSTPRSSGKNNAPRSAARLFAVLFCALVLGVFAALMLGSTETTFYTISVYFGAAGIKNTRYTIPAALFADFIGFFMASLTVRFLY